MSKELNLLFPLDVFYAQTKTPLPYVEQVRSEEVPEPYRRLLVHANDMTPTLEAFHGDRIEIQVLDRQGTEEALMRQVALLLIGSGRAVEYGAIIIHLQRFPPEARAAILEGHIPLGTIMATCRVVHDSCPQAFVRVRSDAQMNRALGLTESQMLYGRRNILATQEGEVLADILEILPPEGT